MADPASLSDNASAIGGAVTEAPNLPAMDADGGASSVSVDLLASPEFWLTVMLLVFGLIVIVAQLYVATRKAGEGAPIVTTEAAIRLSIVTLIIVGALVLIASGFSNNQIAPAMGLFGTIAGYVIGRQDRKE